MGKLIDVAAEVISDAFDAFYRPAVLVVLLAILEKLGCLGG